MRGSPLLRAITAFLILLACGYPLHRMLRAVEAAPSAATSTPPPVAGEKAKVQLQVNFTTPPAEFRVQSLGEVVWKVSAPTASLTHELALTFPAEGIVGSPGTELEFAL